MHQEALDALVRSLKRLQTSSDYSDLKISCGDQVFSVHKAVICPRSDFFAKACTWGKDGQPKGEINFDADDPKVVQLMIDYFYQFDYDDTVLSEKQPENEEPPSSEPELQVEPIADFHDNAASIEEIAEPIEITVEPRLPWDIGLTAKERKRKQKQMLLEGTWEDRVTQEMIDAEAGAEYEPVFEPDPLIEPEAEPEPVYEPEIIPDMMEEDLLLHDPLTSGRKARLCDLAEQSDTRRLGVNAHVYALADKYGIEDLKSLARTKFSRAVAHSWQSEAFVRAAQLAFTNTPNADLGLRTVIIRTSYRHRELMDYEEVQELLDSGNGIAWRLVQVFVSEHK